MQDRFHDALQRFGDAQDARPLDYDAMIGIIRDLSVPPDVTAADLTRYFDCCFRILDLAGDGFGAKLCADVGKRRAGHLENCAREMVEHVLYDRVARNRAWLNDRVTWFREHGREVPEAYLHSDLPPVLSIPWDAPTARERLGPLFKYWQQRLVDNPTAHFGLCWRVMHDGYPVFREVFGDWMRRLEEKGIGQQGTVAAFADADTLLAKAEAGVALSWAACDRDVVALLSDPHPMVVAGAARYLGSLYVSNSFHDDPEAPDLIAILNRLSSLAQFRAIACGGFICGFDVDCSGLRALASNGRIEEADFSIDDWVLDVVAGDDYEPYLPNAQALWFYIHEFYCSDPAMIMRFIDRDRIWLALMCATEVRDAVQGMKPVLERLLAAPDAEVAEAAKAHLTAFYR
jgi:hypothetical protein